MAFDLRTRTGASSPGGPLHDRRARLENVVAGNELVLPVRPLARNGFEAWAEVVARHYEGLVAKDEASLYEAGPTRRWFGLPLSRCYEPHHAGGSSFWTAARLARAHHRFISALLSRLY